MKAANPNPAMTSRRRIRSPRPHGREGEIAASAIASLAAQGFAKICSGLLVTGRDCGLDSIGRAIRMTGFKRRIRIVLDAELHGLSYGLAGNVGHYAEPKVDARRDTTRGDHVSILDDSSLLMRSTHQRQKLGKGPMSRCSAAP